MKSKIAKDILIAITGLLIGTLPAYAGQPDRSQANTSYLTEKNSYLMAGKLKKFKKVLTGEGEEEETKEKKEETKTKETGEEKKGKLREFSEEIKPLRRKYEPRRRKPKKVIIIEPEPWYWHSWHLHRYPWGYDSFRDYYRNLYLRGYISYDEYQALLNRFWYLETERPYYSYRYMEKEIPKKEKVIEKESPKSEKELNLSLSHQFADDISSDSLSFYYMGEGKLALDIRYTDYKEDVNGTEHLQQIDVMALYQLYFKEAQVLIGAGVKGFYGNGNQWGFQVGIETRVPLTERLSFSVNPELAFVSEEIITDLDAKIDYKITDNISAILGYKSLGLPAEDLSIEGLHVGIELVFK